MNKKSERYFKPRSYVKKLELRMGRGICSSHTRIRGQNWDQNLGLGPGLTEAPGLRRLVQR